MTKWDDWSFKLKRTINSMNKSMYRLMAEWEAKEEDINEEEDVPEELDLRSAELYVILCEHCDNEALMVVRQVGDMEGVKA